jgi:hypothetical protein
VPQNTQQAMSILNYMVNKETSVNPALLEGVTQATLHDRVGAHCAVSPSFPASCLLPR